MDKKRTLGYFQLAAAMSLAGSSVIMGKLISHLPIFFAQTISMVFALIAIIPAAVISEGMPKLRNIAKKDYVMMFLQGLFGVLLFRVFMMISLKYTSAASTGIVLSTTPAVLALLSLIFLKERLNFKTVLAVFICFFGMSLLNVDIAGMAIKLDIKLVLGGMFAFFSVCSEAMFTIFRKKQSYSDKPLTSTAIVMFFALILFLPLGGYTAVMNNVFAAVNLLDFVYMMIYGVMCSAAAYAFWFSGLAKVKISEAAGFTGFMPLSSVVLSVFVLGERISLSHIAGITLVLAGIYMIVLKKRAVVYEIDNNS